MIPHILVTDDDPLTIKFLTHMMRNLGYTFGIAYDGREALQKMEEERFNIVIVDLHMPNLDGRTLIKIIKEKYPNVVCIIHSASFNPEDIRDTLSDHKAIDCLKKPVSPEELKNSIDRAFELYRLRCTAQTFCENEMRFYREAMNNFNWKQELRDKHMDYLSRDVITQLNISFNQGGGIGTMLSLLSIFFSKAEYIQDQKGYFIPEDIFELVRDNYDSSFNALQSLSRAQALLTRNEEYTEQIRAGEITELLVEVQKELSAALSIKNQKISISGFPPQVEQQSIVFETTIMKTVLKELLINAMKYSPDEAIIYILAMIRDNYLEIKIINPYHNFDDKGHEITGKYEMLVFEPFFRMSNVMDERFSMQEFGHGLGLPVVKRIVELHGGAIYLHTINNYLNPDMEKNVCATMRFIFCGKKT